MNFIDNIEIKNFKSIRHQKIEGCKKINVFIGYPNVGKSNILEALGLYSVTQQTQGERFDFEKICRYNSFSDFFFDKNTKGRVEIKLNGKLTLSFTNPTDFTKFGININHSDIPTAFDTSVGENNNFQFFSLPEDNLIESEIYKVKYYHFEKDTELTKRRSNSLSIPNGDNLIDILDSNSNIRKEFLELLADYRLKLNIIDGNSLSVSKELGDGTLISFQYNLISDTLRRLFFYKAAIETNQNKVLLFEEPEANMFPPYIKKLTTDILFDKTNQFFLATHSPYVLDELILDAGDDLSVYLVDYKNGETIIHHLGKDDLSEIREYGVDLFFNIESYLKHGQIDNS